MQDADKEKRTYAETYILECDEYMLDGPLPGDVADDPGDDNEPTADL